MKKLQYINSGLILCSLHFLSSLNQIETNASVFPNNLNQHFIKPLIVSFLRVSCSLSNLIG